jgi:hypothetical protein
MAAQPKPLDIPPRARAAPAAFAHPDDETFGLGAVLSGTLGGQPPSTSKRAEPTRTGRPIQRLEGARDNHVDHTAA